MIKNKLNRRFRKALAVSVLATIACSPNMVVNASTLSLVNLTPADRCKVLRYIRFYRNGRNETLEDLNGGSKIISWKRIAEEGHPTDEIYIVAAEYKDSDMSSFQNVIFVKKQTNKWGRIDEGIISILPYHPTILEKLKKYYNKLGPDYSLPNNEGKWWANVYQCVDHLVALDVADKDNLTDKKKLIDKNSGEFAKLCEKYGLTPAEGAAIGLATGAVLVGGAIWAINKTIKTVGEAGGNIIHGNSPATIPTSAVPATIIINNK